MSIVLQRFFYCTENAEGMTSFDTAVVQPVINDS